MKSLIYFFLITVLFSCFENPEVPLQEAPQYPRERSTWRYARKGKELSPEKVLFARRLFERKLNNQIAKGKTRDAGLNAWDEKGPFGIGGRGRSLAIDPNNGNHIFFGSVGGGIWETTDGGITWNQVDDFLATLSIMQISYDPFNDNRIYASTGEGIGYGDALPGMGVFQSTNNGDSWVLLPSSPDSNDFFYVNDIALDPANQGWVYAVTSEGNPGNENLTGFGKIYRSMDGGQNWVLLTTTASRALDIKIDPFDSDNMLIGCSCHLYRSVNATDPTPTYTEITGSGNQIPAYGRRIEISYCLNSNGMVYAAVDDTLGNDGEIWRSDNGGATWAQRLGIGFFGGQGWYDNVIFVDPTNSNRLIVGGVELWRSTDGGHVLTRITNWVDDINGNNNGNNNSIHADHHAIVPFNNYDGNSNNGVFIANDGGLYSTNNIWTVTQNSGWNSNVGDLAVTQYYGGHISSDGNTIIGGAQDNAFSFTTDGGNTWTQPFTGDGAYAAVNYNNDSIIYANGNNNVLVKSVDNGTTWNIIARFKTTTNAAGNCAPSACCAGGQYPPAGCISNGIFYAEDSCSLISLFVMDPNDPDNLAVGCKRLWRNTNAGVANAWTAIKSAVGTAKITAIDIDFGNSQRIWAGYDNGRLERTTNTGGNWSGDIKPAGTPGSPYVTDIAINPNNSNEVIVSYGGYNTSNLFYTSNANNANPNWTNINTGIPLQINSVEWHPDNSNWIYAGTDFGILASEDKGQTWNITPIYNSHDGPVNTEVSELFWQPGTTTLCTATHGRGIWCSNPIRDKVYVDMNFVGSENGTLSNPYNTFKEALDAAGNGSTIIFLSGGSYDEIPGDILEERRIRVQLDPGAATPTIIE